MTKLNFDAEKVEPLGSFEPIPVGDYTVVISETEMKDAKTGKGQYLQLVYTVLDGDYKGRKIFDRLNLINENVTASEIAQRALSSICRAVNVMHPKDSEELHDKPFVVKVGIRPAKDDYNASNSVKGYSALDSVGPVAAAKKEEKKPSSSKRPWEK